MIIEDKEILFQTLKALKIIYNSKINNQINMEEIGLITPFLITPITSHINSIKNNKTKIIFPKKGYIKTYLDTIKFPLAVSNTKELKQITKKTYCPLYEIKNEVLGENYTILELLEEIIIKPYNLKKNIQPFMFIFDELMCNIQQHAKSKFNCIQAQIYDNNMLGISIVDNGITIPQNYIDNKIKGFDNDVDLLKLVFKGISTKPEKERGTGIPNSYKLITKGFNGSFLLISRDAGVLKLKNSELQFFNLNELGFTFSGTIINMFFEVPKDKINIYDFINQPL